MKIKRNMNLRNIQKAKLIGLCEGLERRVWKREVAKIILWFLCWSFLSMGNIERWSDLKFGVKDHDFCLGTLSLRHKKDIKWLYVVVQSSEKRSGQKRYIGDRLSN